MLELTLMLSHTEGALLRLLGLIERRGFALGQIHTEPRPDGLAVRLLLPQGSRSADVLLRQVQRLYEVRKAQLDTVASHVPGVYRNPEFPLLRAIDLPVAAPTRSVPAGGIPA